DGTIGTPTTRDWIHNKRYIPISDGTFDIKLYINGQAKALIFDKDKNIIQVLENLGGSYNYTQTVTPAEGARFFKTSFPPSVVSTPTNTYFKNLEKIYLGQEASNKVVEKDASPVNSIAVLDLNKRIRDAQYP